MGFVEFSRLPLGAWKIRQLFVAVMNGFIIGLYGVYLLLVGLSGNSDKLIQMMRADSPGFLPWAVSIAVLAAMYEVDALRPIAKPFIFLLILTFVLKNFKTLEAQMNVLYSKAGVKK